MSEYLGIDTSNYTTSVAVFDGLRVKQKKLLLPVKEGEKGLRQSDALFHHTRQLPKLLEEILPESDISAVGVSVRPRNIGGSYMPCFLAGRAVSRSIAAFGKIPLYETSHQVGHILAALWSCRKLELLNQNKPFIAFHLSGGTTDCLLITPDKENVINCREIATSLDLKAGQVIDRVGIMLNLKFPCGPELEKLALNSSESFKIKPAMKDGNCCLSGVENICRKMIDSGVKPCDAALYCLKYIEAALVSMTEFALSEFGNLPLIYAGGVMSNSIIRKTVENRFCGSFATPEFSSDNACGVSVFAAIKDGYLK